MMGNQLWFGDNLTVLRENIATSSVDLVYLDPPFNSKANYNVLFRSPRDEAASAQVEAFRDTWTWGEEAQRGFDEIMRGGAPVTSIIRALHSALGESDMMAYLVMMAQRLVELRRVLSETGSLYLHCDSTASHYLKILLDSTLGPRSFTNEIIWKRTSPKGLASTRFPACHDVILFYRRGSKFVWNSQFLPHSEEYIERYSLIDESTGRRFQATSLINPNQDRPNLRYDFHGHHRVWRWTKERMQEAEANGEIYIPPGGGVPRQKRFLDQQEGVPATSVWTDIPAVNAMARERQGYPTQKPIALLERIVAASSNPDSVVLDPFCGCGTTVAAATTLGRPWIGIDIAYHAIRVIEARLMALPQRVDYRVDGIPKDFEAAERLARDDKFQFQWWANYLVGVQALKEVKRGPDRGIDGEMYFMNGPMGWGRILTSVKGGIHVGVKDVREFRSVIERERAEMGLFVCLREPTRDMATEAAGFGSIATAHGRLPRLQIVPVERWFKGWRPIIPTLRHIPQQAVEPRAKRAKATRRPDPNAPQFPFSFTGGRNDDRVVHINPAAVEREFDLLGEAADS